MIGKHRPLTKTQAEGLAVVVAMTALFYVFVLLVSFFRPFADTTVPFGIDDPGTLAVALNADGQERGVFFMPPGTTVADLLSASGAAPASSLDGSDDRPLLASDKVYVTSASKSLAVIGRMGGAQSLALDLPLDINRLALEELVLVPGIGDKMAVEIIALREKKGRFRTLDELKEIRGIKEKKLSHLRRFLRVLP